MPRASLFPDCVLQFQSKPVDDDNTAVTRATGIICLLSHLKGTIVYHLYFLSEFSVCYCTIKNQGPNITTYMEKQQDIVWVNCILMQRSRDEAILM